MKLSDLSNDKTLDILIELIPYIDDILENEEIIKLSNFKGLNNKQVMINILKIIKVLALDYRKELYSVWGLICDKDCECLMKEKAYKTVFEIYEFVNDDIIMDFLQSIQSKIGKN